MKILPGALLALIGATAFAQDMTRPPMKAGLWEMSQVHQIVDGKDLSATMAAMNDRMQQALANLSPAQRSQYEAMMGHSAAGATAGSPGGGMRICISPELAARNQPFVPQRQGKCETSNMSRAGNQISFDFNCSRPNGTAAGKSSSTVDGDLVRTHVEMSTTDPRGTHTILSDTQMKYLGADCQGLKPIDQIAQEKQKSNP